MVALIYNQKNLRKAKVNTPIYRLFSSFFDGKEYSVR